MMKVLDFDHIAGKIKVNGPKVRARMPVPLKGYVFGLKILLAVTF
jgi:hypothetical protein